MTNFNLTTPSLFNFQNASQGASSGSWDPSGFFNDFPSLNMMGPQAALESSSMADPMAEFSQLFDALFSAIQACFCGDSFTHDSPDDASESSVGGSSGGAVNGASEGSMHGSASHSMRVSGSSETERSSDGDRTRIRTRRSITIETETEIESSRNRDDAGGRDRLRDRGRLRMDDDRSEIDDREDDELDDPLMFDLNGKNGVGTTNADGPNSRMFDVKGDGNLAKVGWAEQGDGVLAFDGDNNGVAGETGREVFGNATDIGEGQVYANGFDALKAFADKHIEGASDDNKLDQNELDQLSDKGLTMLVDGQARSLRDLGVSQINLNYRQAGTNADVNGNQHRQVGSFVKDGEERAANNVWLRQAKQS